MFLEKTARIEVAKELDEQYGDDLIDSKKCEEIIQKLEEQYSNCIKDVCYNS